MANEDSARYLQALFGLVESGYYFLTWTLSDKTSAWHTGIDTVENKDDTYVGMSLSTKDRGGATRGRAAESAGIPGLWADIDIGTRDSAKPYFRSRGEAIGFIEKLPLTPTVIVDSGNGYHVYWLLKEPWLFDQKNEWKEAANLAKAWEATIQARATQIDRAIDSTADLARILRLPGTRNTKYDKLVVIERFDDKIRYEPDNFEPYLVAMPPESYEVDTESLIFNQLASPPEEKWKLLLRADPRVKPTWEYDRRDFEDQTPSAFDMALADYAAAYAWEDQEILNLLIAFRREHQLDRKFDNFQYYYRTIAKARTGAASQVALNVLAERGLDKRTTLHNLSKVLGFTIQRMIRYDEMPGRYRIQTGDGSVPLNDVTVMTTWAKFMNSVFDATGVLIPTYKRNDWLRIAQRLRQCCDKVATGAENTEAGRMEEWLELYLNLHPPERGNIAEQMERRIPLITPEGYKCLFLTDLRQWVFVSQGIKVSLKQLGAWMRLVSWKPHDIHTRDEEGAPLRRSAWRREGI